MTIQISVKAHSNFGPVVAQAAPGTPSTSAPSRMAATTQAQTVVTTSTVAPTSTSSSSGTNSGTLIAVAIIAVCGVILTALVQLYIGSRSANANRTAAQAAKDNALAAKTAAEAAKGSAKAAQDAVGVNAAAAADLGLRAEVDALARRYQQSAEQLGPTRLQFASLVSTHLLTWPTSGQDSARRASTFCAPICECRVATSLMTAQ